MVDVRGDVLRPPHGTKPVLFRGDKICECYNKAHIMKNIAYRVFDHLRL